MSSTRAFKSSYLIDWTTYLCTLCLYDIIIGCAIGKENVCVSKKSEPWPRVYAFDGSMPMAARTNCSVLRQPSSDSIVRTVSCFSFRLRLPTIRNSNNATDGACCSWLIIKTNRCGETSIKLYEAIRGCSVCWNMADNVKAKTRTCLLLPWRMYIGIVFLVYENLGLFWNRLSCLNWFWYTNPSMQSVTFIGCQHTNLGTLFTKLLPLGPKGSLPIICPPGPHFAFYCECKVVRGLILESSVSLDYTPTQTHGCGEITLWLGCSYPEEQQQRWSCTTRSSQVCWYFLQKSGSEITCSHQWWQEMKFNWVSRTCLHLQGRPITLFAKLKAYFNTVLQMFHRLLYR